MPRVARAPAIPPPPPLPALSLVLTGQVYLVSVKKGRLLTKSAIFDSSLGKKGETTNTQTSVGKQNGLVLFTEIILNHRPSGTWGSYVDNPPLKPSTIHAGTCFPGRSPLPTGDRPHQRPFSRMVTPSNRGPSTPEAVFPAGQRLERDGVVQGDMPPPARGCLRSDWPCADRAGGGRRCRPVPWCQEGRHHRRRAARSGGYGSAGMRGTQPKRFSSPAGRYRCQPRIKIGAFVIA